MAKKKDDELQNLELNQQSQIQEGTKIKSLGPNNKDNGATILRYKREDRGKTPIDIQAGMILSVGDDITKVEDKRLLSLKNWRFERVEA